MDKLNKRFFEQCEREQLHLSGVIQPHGTLLVLNRDGLVTHAAANVAEFLDVPAASLLGAPPPERLAALSAGIDVAPGARLLSRGMLEGVDARLDLVAIRNADGGINLELGRHVDSGADTPTGVPLARTPADAQALAAARAELVERIADLTGFQRVMFYLFREEGDGEVIAEARRGEAYGSYLGLRFPASDIPLIARALYLKNPWRLIPDAQAEPVPVLGRTSDPPDLTWSDLRGVSPVHRVYLGNMGARASLSFPVVVGGALVALVAGHHREPRIPPLNVLEQAAALVRGHGLLTATYQSERRIRLIDGLSRRFDAITGMFMRHANLASSWPELSAWLMREFHADGAVLCLGDDTYNAGIVFEPAALAAFDQWFRERQGELVWAGDSLSRQVPGMPLSEIAGTLAMRVATTRGAGPRLYLTRVEHIHEVAWGGTPDKPVELHDGELGIAPRRSFEKWVEKRLGYSRAWDNEARLIALKLRELLQQEIRR